MYVGLFTGRGKGLSVPEGRFAGVAELADAPDLGSGVYIKISYKIKYLLFMYFCMCPKLCLRAGCDRVYMAKLTKQIEPEKKSRFFVWPSS